MSFWRADPDGVTILVKVHPRARRPGILGVRDSAAGPRLRIAVAEPPEDGKATQAVRALLARTLHRPEAAVRVVAGATNSEKTLAVAGDTDDLVDRLRAL